MKNKRIVVVGTSAGGLDALKKLIGSLPKDFPAPIFIVQHMAADSTGEILIRILNMHGKLKCKHPHDGEKFQGGSVYVAQPDHHMLVTKGKIIISKGARENRSRPAIDPLFRSAAVAYGAKVVGVLLSGYLDDGTSGLIAIQRCGGTCVVQDPLDATYPEMPQHALNNLKPDHCVPLATMGELLNRILSQPVVKSPPVPKDVAAEATIAERVVSDVQAVENLGKQVPFNCPDCGGVLWEVKRGKLLRYRCHTGHAFTADVLLAEQAKHIEETLWVALRMFEERKNLLRQTARPSHGEINRSAVERAKESEIHIERIRAILLSSAKAREPKAKHARALKRPRNPS
jgi:two-component system chemotaxis response regulator CheB